MSSFRGSRRRRFMRPRYCVICAESAPIDYKDIDTLRRFMTRPGKIRPRRQTGLCGKHQRALAVAVKRARHIALLPFTSD
ncbi:MAG: 30S ribosomal protein S18 [Chloroflexota bacterium]